MLSHFLVDDCVDSGSDETVCQHQQMTWQPKSSLTGNFTLDFKQLRFCALFLQTLELDIPNGLQILASSESNSVHSVDDMLLMLSLAQEWLDSRNATLVAHFLDTSVCGGS